MTCAPILSAECRCPKSRRIEVYLPRSASSQAAHSPAVQVIRNTTTSAKRSPIAKPSARSSSVTAVSPHARQALLDVLAVWWADHSPRLVDLPLTRALNAARAELLKSFTAAPMPLALLDWFKLAGVVAAWWTDALPDLKTLIK